jgi:hypothetical protein
MGTRSMAVRMAYAPAHLALGRHDLHETSGRRLLHRIHLYQSC